jgi:hypothetical protein
MHVFVTVFEYSHNASLLAYITDQIQRTRKRRDRIHMQSCSMEYEIAACTLCTTMSAVVVVIATPRPLMRPQPSKAQHLDY